MAEVAITTNNTATRDGTTVGVEDVLPVRSRVSWPAVVAGSILALAFYFLLTLLGGAIGLSISDKVEARTIGVGAAVYAIVITALCLFAGGWVASQLTTGENKQEGAMYGLLVWAAVIAMLLWLMASGVKAGFSALVGVATAGTAVADVTARNTTQEDWEVVARRAGYTQAQIEEFKAKAKAAPADARDAVEDPETKRKAEELARETAEVSTRVAWWACAGVMLSMAAAAGGGFVGAGPSFRLFTTPVARTVVTQRRVS